MIPGFPRQIANPGMSSCFRRIFQHVSSWIRVVHRTPTGSIPNVDRTGDLNRPTSGLDSSRVIDFVLRPVVRNTNCGQIDYSLQESEIFADKRSYAKNTDASIILGQGQLHVHSWRNRLRPMCLLRVAHPPRLSIAAC